MQWVENLGHCGSSSLDRIPSLGTPYVTDGQERKKKKKKKKSIKGTVVNEWGLVQILNTVQLSENQELYEQGPSLLLREKRKLPK